MNFATSDFVPLKDWAEYLKNSPKSEMNVGIIGLYGSFLVETKYQNDIAIKRY